MCRSVMKLLPPNARVKTEKSGYAEKNITDYKRKRWRSCAGSKVSMNCFRTLCWLWILRSPCRKNRSQKRLSKIRKYPERWCWKKAIEMLKLVGISDAEQLIRTSTSFFGGMRQRCVIAIALAYNPQILFTDEATTAPGCNCGSQNPGSASGNSGKNRESYCICITWSGSCARIADRVAVMYAGKDRRDRNSRRSLLWSKTSVYMGTSFFPFHFLQMKRCVESHSGNAAIILNPHRGCFCCPEFSGTCHWLWKRAADV